MCRTPRVDDFDINANFTLVYSLVFGSIFALSWLAVDNFAFVPEIIISATFAIWIGGLAIYYILNAMYDPIKEIKK